MAAKCPLLSVLVLTLVVLSAACASAGSSPPSPTPAASKTPGRTATLTKTLTASLIPATPTPPASSAMPTFQSSVPPRPATIEEYPQAIADYLNKAGDAALGPPCLADLLAAWQMPDGDRPGLSAGQARCVLGNTDADPENEVIVSLSALNQINGPLSTDLVVFDNTPRGYRVAFQFQSLDSGKGTDVPYVVLSTGDLTGDGVGDLAFAVITFGAHTCTWQVHVVSGDDSASYLELTPPDGLQLATADVQIEDTNGDGTKEIIMHGGVIQSAGAGPQRARTDIYAWDGQQFSLRSSTNDPSNLRYFKVRDADEAFSSGDYSTAVALYQQAINDPDLQDARYVGSRDELMAYSLFRSGLSYLKLGDTNDASRQIEAAIANYPVSLGGKAALAFRNAINLTQVGAGDLSTGCQAVIAFANQNLQRFQEVWNYGYANPGFDAVKFCPF